MAEKQTVLGVINIMAELFKLNVLHKDPNEPNNMFVYLTNCKNGQDGWYSKNILTVASDCFQDKKNLESLITEAKQHGVDTEECFKNANILLNE